MTQATMDPPATAELAVVKRSFQPLAPIESASALKGLLEAQRNGIAIALPKHITPERLIKTLLVAANRNPDILKCTQASIIETINRAAELGLDLSGTLGEAYPVPFNNKVKWKDEDGREREEWKMQLTLIIGYRGMEKLAWQSGEVESIDAEVVRKADRFVFRKGTEVLVEWEPALTGDRGEVVGAYACVKMKNGGKLARFLPLSDIEKIRNSAKSKDSPAWRNWWDEMARKCALKRTLKDAPLSTEKFVRAMETDEADYAMADVLEAQTVPRRGTAGLLKKLTDRPVSEGQTFVPDPEAANDTQADRPKAETQAAPAEPAAPAPTMPDTTPTPPAPASGPISSEPTIDKADTEPPESDDDMLRAALNVEWPHARKVCINAGVDKGGMRPVDAALAVDAWAKMKAKPGQEGSIKLADRIELYHAMADCRVSLRGHLTPKLEPATA